MAFELRGSLRSRAKPIAGLSARSADAKWQQIGRQHPRRPAVQIGSALASRPTSKHLPSLQIDGRSGEISGLGLEVEPERVILAGEHTIRFMAEQHANARIKLIASDMIRRYANERCCQLVERDADFVVLALDRRFNYRKLEAVVNEISEGARLVVTNGDSSHPAPGGKLIPETGALMHAVIGCSPVAPYLVVGKPGHMLFEEGLKRLGADPADTIMIGDNPLTDALGAVRLGMPFLLVGTTHQADAPSPSILLKTNCPGHVRAPVSISLADDYRLADRLNTA